MVVYNSINKKSIQCEPRTTGNIFRGDTLYKDNGGVNSVQQDSDSMDPRSLECLLYLQYIRGQKISVLEADETRLISRLYPKWYNLQYIA